MTLTNVLNRCMNGVHEDYTCWRITGELLKSIESCPRGSLKDCMHLIAGDVCRKGERVKI